MTSGVTVQKSFTEQELSHFVKKIQVIHIYDRWPVVIY
jgi:hypothetical protein